MRVDNCQQSSSFVFTSKDGKKTRSKEKWDSAAKRNTGPSPLDNKRTQSYGHCRGVTAGISVGWFSKGITAFFYYVTSVLLVLVKNPFLKREKRYYFYENALEYFTQMQWLSFQTKLMMDIFTFYEQVLGSKYCKPVIPKSSPSGLVFSEA